MEEKNSKFWYVVDALWGIAGLVYLCYGLIHSELPAPTWNEETISGEISLLTGKAFNFAIAGLVIYSGALLYKAYRGFREQQYPSVILWVIAAGGLVIYFFATGMERT